MVEMDLTSPQQDTYRGSTQTDLVRCPNCSAAYRPGEIECHQCGIVFRKYDERQKFFDVKKRETSFDVSPELRLLWEEVILNYEDLDTHQNFVSAAWAEGGLGYAAMKYRSIIEAMPHDEMAARLIEEIKSLASLKFEAVATSEKAPLERALEKSWLDNAATQFRRFGFVNLIFVGCGILIATGYFVPGLRNLIGMGTSIFIFIWLLRFYFKMI